MENKEIIEGCKRIDDINTQIQTLQKERDGIIFNIQKDMPGGYAQFETVYNALTTRNNAFDR